MSSRRTLILVGAIGVAALAALMILRYVGNVKEEAEGKAQRISVIVALGEIPSGTTADDAVSQGLLGEAKRPKGDLPTAAVTRLEDITGMTAAIAISGNEVITSSMFESASSSSSSSGALDPGNVAVTVSVDSAHSVGGLVNPGDYVNVLVDNPASTDGNTIGTSVVLQKVKVLAIGTNLGAKASSSDTEGTTTSTGSSDQVTFEVPLESAQVLATAAQRTLRLVLVRPDYEPHPVPQYSYTTGEAFPGQNGWTPYDSSPSTGTKSGSGE